MASRRSRRKPEGPPTREVLVTRTVAIADVVAGWEIVGASVLTDGSPVLLWPTLSEPGGLEPTLGG